MTVDHGFAVAHSKQVGKRAALVTTIAFFFRDTFAGVLEHNRTFRNVLQGEATCGMNVGGACYEARQECSPCSSQSKYRVFNRRDFGSEKLKEPLTKSK